MGHASLMRPDRPLPTVPFAVLPLRRGPNAAAAIIAALLTRGHDTSTSGRKARTGEVASLFVYRGDRLRQCQWTFGRNLRARRL